MSAIATTTTMPPANVNKNIVTIILMMGVPLGVTLIFALVKLIPKLRSGEVSMKSIDFDWRAELLNQTPKKEKARQAEERARREEELAAGRADDFDEAGAQHYHPSEPLSPHRASASGDKRVQVEVYVPEDNRETR